jgi:hypothetical protein
MKPPRYISGELFLRGPIPLAWLAAAGQIGGKALHVGVYLWHLAGLNDDMTVKLFTGKLRYIGVTRQAAYLALAGLEREGLIFVERRAGAHPLVTLNRHHEVSETATATCSNS